MSVKSEKFAAQVTTLVARFQSAVAGTEWVTHVYPKKMRDEDNNFFTVPTLTLQKGPTRLYLDPTGYDIPGLMAWPTCTSCRPASPWPHFTSRRTLGRFIRHSPRKQWSWRSRRSGDGRTSAMSRSGMSWRRSATMPYHQSDWWRYINDVGKEYEASRVAVARLTDRLVRTRMYWPTSPRRGVGLPEPHKILKGRTWFVSLPRSSLPCGRTRGGGTRNVSGRPGWTLRR